jgi:general secretion pathway protein E
MAQRLLRVICPQCKKPYVPDSQTMTLFSKRQNTERANKELYKGLGCENCFDTGYRGRTGIFELLVIEDDIKELILKRTASHIIKAAAVQKGMSTLREDGLLKAQSGETTLEEVCRITQDTVHTEPGVMKRVDRPSQSI